MYTYFDKTKKVLCVIQIVEDATASSAKGDSVMLHDKAEKFDDIYTEAEKEAYEYENTEYQDSVKTPAPVI